MRFFAKVLIILAIAVVAVSLFSSETQAANCGGATVCSCGDTVTASATLTGNLSCTGHGLIVGANNITLDGNNYALTGDGSGTDYGIKNIDNWDNVTIKNFSITNFNRGIYFGSSTSALIQNNTVSSSTNYGIYLTTSGSSSIIGNTVNSNGAGGIVLVSSTSTVITSNTTNLNSFYGIYLSASPSSTLTSNTSSFNTNYGIYLTNSGSSTLTSNTTNVNGSYAGIYISASLSTVLTSNTANLNNYGFYINDTSGATITSNTASDNVTNLYDYNKSAGSNTYSSNQFIHNINNTMVTSTEVTRTKSVNDTITLNISMFNASGTACPNCTYSITTSPSETVTSVLTNNNLTNSFTATKSGLYSLSATVTDSNSNSTKRNYHFFVGATSSAATTYYFWGTNPTHGQPQSVIGADDARSLFLTASTNTENGDCTNWTQNSPDELPEYPLAVLSKVDTNIWYTAAANGYVGVKRATKYDNGVDASSSISSAVEYTLSTSSFSNLNWGMDYLRSWYWLSVKVISTSPYWRSTPSLPSYAVFTYSYTTTPTINSASNENIFILSATTPATSTSTASIVLNNPNSSATSTNLTLASFNYPFSNVTNRIYSDNSNTLVISDLTANATTSFDSVNMTVTPSIGSVDVVIDTWETSGGRDKKWTETLSYGNITTSHLVGDMLPGRTYNLKVNGAVFRTLEADSAGLVGFSYTHSHYGTRTFELVRGQSPGGGSLPMEAYSPPERPKQGFGLVIKNGDSFTESRIVPLKLSGGPDTTRMAISNLSDFRDASQEEYKEIKEEWDICSEANGLIKKIDSECVEGIYTIYAKFYNSWGQSSETVSSSIVYTKQPRVNEVTIERKNSFTRDLYLGIVGDDVKLLQKFLNSSSTFKLADIGPGSPGKETKLFGMLTKRALIKFQEFYAEAILKPWNFKKGTGYFGPTTRKFVNAL